MTLYAVYALGRRKGYPRFVTELELAAEAPLMASLDGDETPEASRLRLTRGLEAAVERGALLRLDAGTQALYFLNTPVSERAINRYAAGGWSWGGRCRRRRSRRRAETTSSRCTRRTSAR